MSLVGAKFFGATTDFTHTQSHKRTPMSDHQ